MRSNLDRFKDDLHKLIKLGEAMNDDLIIRDMENKGELDKEYKEYKKKIEGCFEREYQKWYTEAHAVVWQIIPHRIEEFEELYRGTGKRKALAYSTYSIQDWINGVRSATIPFSGEKYFNDFAAMAMKFKTQLNILQSANSRFESSLLDIGQVLRSDLFDSELDAARELLRNGFLRGAGAIAGVVLERHLGQMCKNHKLTMRKKNPSISDWNDLLKNNNLNDIPTWRFIQRLGDIRNLCDHNKDRDPMKEEVAELIDGTEKMIKTLF